jgi:Domain of unknown function (DUF6305)
MALGCSAMAQEAETEPSIFEQPVLITSIGQSAGAAQAKILALKAGIEYVYEQRVTLEQLEGIKTLIVVPGASGKGLGAAGVDIDGELAWATELIDRAEELGIQLIVLHIEGQARRGPSSQLTIDVCASRAAHIIVKGAATEEDAAEMDEVANGNFDFMFSDLAAEYELPINFVATTLDVIPVLQELFGIEVSED